MHKKKLEAIIHLYCNAFDSLQNNMFVFKSYTLTGS